MDAYAQSVKTFDELSLPRKKVGNFVVELILVSGLGEQEEQPLRSSCIQSLDQPQNAQTSFTGDISRLRLDRRLGRRITSLRDQTGHSWLQERWVEVQSLAPRSNRVASCQAWNIRASQRS